jgi:hypothetical protein
MNNKANGVQKYQANIITYFVACTRDSEPVQKVQREIGLSDRITHHWVIE